MRPFLFWCWLLALVFGNSPAVQASYVRGGDITYATVPSTTAGVPRYRVVVRACWATTPPFNMATTVTLLATAGNSCSVAGTTSPMQLTQVVNGPTASCTAATNPLFLVAYVVAYYEATLDLPRGQWVLSCAPGSRPQITLNAYSSALAPCGLTAYIDNTAFAPDSSPQFESGLVPTVNISAVALHSTSAFDAEGDSLSYESVLPTTACNYQSGFQSSITPHFNVVAATGALIPAATPVYAASYYAIAIQVREYRRAGPRWALLGYVTREVVYTVGAATNQPPTFTAMQVNSGASQPPSAAAIAVQPGQAVNVTLQATDPDVGQALRFASEAPAVVPGLTLTRLGTTNNVQLTWQVPATLPPGRYNIPIAVLDDGCPYNASEERTLTFVVGSTALATRAQATATDVYPVPFREQVQFTTAPNQAVVLVDALGREVARLTSAPSGLVRWQPAPTLPAGLYLARSASNGQPLACLLRAE